MKIKVIFGENVSPIPGQTNVRLSWELAGMAHREGNNIIVKTEMDAEEVNQVVESMFEGLGMKRTDHPEVDESLSAEEKEKHVDITFELSAPAAEN